MKDQKAFSTFEFLVSLFIGLSLLSGIAAGLHHFILTEAKLRLESHENYVYIRIRNLLEQVIDDLDSHRFELGPRVHRNGLITFTDNTPNPVSSLSGDNAPHPESDAVTGLGLDAAQSYRIKDAEKKGNNFEYFACRESNTGQHSSDKRSYIGISSDGYVELTGTSTSQAGSCRIFNLSPTPSMSVPQQNVDPLWVRKLVPINRHYTIYLSRDLHLRYLSHNGAANIENQPMISEAGKLKLSLEFFFDNRITGITAEVFSLTGREKKFAAVNNLARLKHYNFLFNNQGGD